MFSNIDFINISPMKETKNDGFEEFVRDAPPDGGVRCFWILEDGSEVV